MFGRLGVRGKILAVVAVPILVLLVAAGAVTFAATRTWDSARNDSQLLTVADAAGRFSTALEDEREYSASFVDSFSQSVLGRARAEAAVNSSYLALREKVASVAGDQRAAALDALAQVDALVDLRTTADPTTGVETVVSVGAVPVNTRTGIYQLRAMTYVENPGDWPTFLGPVQTDALATGYSQVHESVLAVSLTATAAGGVGDAVSALASAIEEEATQANLATGTGALVEPIQTARLATDAAKNGFEDVVAKISTRTENLAIQPTLDSVEIALTTLETQRGSVRDRVVAASFVADYYESIIAPLTSLPDVISGGITQRPLARSLSASAAVGEFIDALRLEEIASATIIRQGSFTGQAQLISLTATQSRTESARENAQASIVLVPGAASLPSYGASLDPVAGTSFASQRQSLTDGDNAALPGIRAAGTWPTYVQRELNLSFRPAQAALWTRVTDQAQANVRGALLQTVFTALGAVLIVLASLFIAFVIARRIVNPLRRLTTTATAVRQELPRLVERVALPGQSVDVSEVQIPVESADEIGRLAEAFNAVNAATLAIAGEQAALRGSISEMFVNVARRDQVLLNRQLASIDEMERTQDDPATLMRLFALDHLATRMRRNSESLLVLAGIDSGRRMRRPMPLSDVIRTASSEIELYERVELVLDADPSMVGHSALTAGHLFAELLENATVFSDPDTKVEVRTTEKDGSFVVEIVDHGIGMTPEELRQANARVVSSAASEILGAQRLGLFVIGRIARRIGARVELQSEEGKGTTATVVLPRSLFDMSADVERTAPHSVSTVDERLHVPAALITHSEDEEVDDYSAGVTSRAITGERGDSAAAGESVERGESYEPTESAGAAEASRSETAVSTDDIDELIKADVASAPASEEVDLSALTTGVTASGLPTRRRGSKTGSEVKPETTTILGLPERPTSGQLDELARQRELEGTFGAPVAERRTAIFRSFRARGSELDAPSAEIPSLERDAKVGPARAEKGAVVEPEIVEAVPVLEMVPEATAEAEPAPVAKLKRAPEPESASDGVVEHPEPPDEVASEPEVTDNGKADRGETPDEYSEGGPGAGLTSGDDRSSATEPLGVKTGDEEGAMAPDWSLGQDPAISNGFGHGDVFTDGDDAFTLANGPLAIPGLEPSVDDASGFEPPEGAASIPTVYASQEYPELAVPAEVAPAAETPAHDASPFAPVQAPAASAEGVDAAARSGERPPSKPKKRRGLFGRRAKDATPAAPAPQGSASIFAAVTPSPAPAYEAPAPAYEAPAPAYEAPAPAYEAPAPAYEAPAPAYEAPAPAYEASAPAYDEPAAPPFGDWTVAPAIPVEADGSTPYSIPEIANVDTAAFGEPRAYAVPDYAEPTAQAEPFEVNYDIASYGAPSNPDFAAPVGASLEIPTIESAPLAYGYDADQAPAPQVAEYPSADFAEGSETPPAWEDYAAEAPSGEATIPPFEVDAELAPMAAPEYPQYGDQPAYPAAGFYEATGLYGEPPAYSSDQFAQPYGWEAAGADALEAAGFEPDYRGYSPEAFSAPPPTEDYEADVASAVFSELRSLSSERPTIQRTKAGLTRRAPSALATAGPLVEVESKAVARNPETVRASFAGFYTGTTRGRADAAALPTDVHGSSNNEVTP
jgi:signal transduction histidine kinase